MGQAQRMQAAQYRLAQHYLDKLRTAQRTYQQGNESATHALALFDQEREQVKQWQAWVVAHAEQDEQATALCSAYAEASPGIFKLRFLPQEYRVWQEAALLAARRLGDHRAEAAHLLGLCVTSEFINTYHHLIDYAQQALSIARQIDDRPLAAQGLNLCGNACRSEGKLEEAQAYFEQSLDLYRAIGDRRGMAEVLNNLAGLAILRRNNATAQGYLEQSLALYKKVGDQEGLATCFHNLGFLAIRLGNFTAAGDYLRQALAICRVIGDTQGISLALSNLGIIVYYQGDYSCARDYLEQGLALTRAAGNQELEAGCLYDLGQVTMAQGDLHKARDYFEQSLIFGRSMEKSTLLPISLSNLAIIYLLLHEEDRAYAILREGLEVAYRFPVELYKLKALVAVTRVWILRGKPLQAAIWLGLVENHPDPAIKMTDIKRDLQVAHAECEAAVSPEQFAAAWEAGKILDLDTVVMEILSEL